MRKLFSLLVALLATTTLWAYDFQSGDLYYNITSDTVPYTIEVTYQYKGSDLNYSGLTSAEIPASVIYDGITYDVTSVGERAFRYCSALTSITIPESVTTIGNAAFSYCSSLTSVTIPNSITSIGETAFANCSSLTSVTISEGITSIGRMAFWFCSSLTSITIPNSITSIGEMAFAGSDLRSVTIDSETIINDNSLASIFGQVTEYIIGKNVRSIGNYTFSNCSSLIRIIVEQGNTTYDSRNNCNAIIETATNMLIAGCQSTSIPNSVTSIGETAFFNCSSLTSIDIPNSVISIGSSAFCFCSSLTSITIPNSVKSIASSVFSDCSALTSIIIPNSVTSIGNYAFSHCSSLISIVIPNSVTNLGGAMFFGCSSLKSVTLPNGIKSLTTSDTLNFYGFFHNCSSLTSIIIPNSVTSIGINAFNGCSSLTSITIPNGVTSIGNNAFNGCSSLASVTIGNNVTSIGDYTFDDCSSLTSITIPNSVTSVGNNALDGCFFAKDNFINNSNCTSANNWGATIFDEEYNDLFIRNNVVIGCRQKLISAIIPNSVISIGDSAFFEREYLKTVIIGDSVTNIGKRAFYNCEQLESITIGNGLTHVEDNAFRYCKNIDTILWNASNLSTIPNDLFKDSQKNISSFIFGKDIKHIPNNLCAGMTNLQSLTIPKNIQSIAKGAFNECTELTSLTWNAPIGLEDAYFNDSYPLVDANLSKLKVLSIGSDVPNLGKKIFYKSRILYDIYCYAPFPPLAYDSTFLNSNAYLHIPCDMQRYYLVDLVWKNFHIECIHSDNVTTEGVTITPDINSVTITWPIANGANTYVLIINKEGEEFCTLTFSADGQLLNIAFAPGRNRQHAPAAEQSERGFSFMVTGLEEATHYTYEITAQDVGYNTLLSYSGEFTTKGGIPTSLENVQQIENLSTLKILRDGQLLILRDGNTYNVMGVIVE